MLLLAACATTPPITVDDLTIRKGPIEISHGVGTLTVASVKSISQSAHYRKPVDTRVFQQALSQTLRESGLFTSVSTELGGDFTIESEIIHEAPIDPYSITVPLLIHYKLIDAKSEKIIWKINTFSQPNIPYKKSEAGLTGEIRHNTMLQAAVRDSFEQVLESLHQLW